MEAKEFMEIEFMKLNYGDEWNTEEMLKKYSNQRVIEELEEIKIRLSKKSFSEHCLEEVDNRIKELKQ
jgi:hypothetical protein